MSSFTMAVCRYYFVGLVLSGSFKKSLIDARRVTSLTHTTSKHRWQKALDKVVSFFAALRNRAAAMLDDKYTEIYRSCNGSIGNIH